MFPPANLFGTEIADMPSVWLEWRSFLAQRGAALQTNFSQGIIFSLAHGLYHEAEDRLDAVKIVNAIFASRGRVRQNVVSNTDLQPSQPTTSPGASEYIYEKCVAHKIAMRLKKAEIKFLGDLAECWMDLMVQYQQIAKD